jgi:hypothetical protein
MNHKIGTLYTYTSLDQCSSGVYLLAKVDSENRACLINIKTGNYWVKSVVVNDPEKITYNEFLAISDGSKFIKVEA